MSNFDFASKLSVAVAKSKTITTTQQQPKYPRYFYLRYVAKRIAAIANDFESNRHAHTHTLPQTQSQAHAGLFGAVVQLFVGLEGH